MSNIQPRGRVQVYGLGGAGINIGTKLEKHRGQLDDGFATIDTAYIDTSKSNITTAISSEHTYLIDGLDGSGKLRRQNHEEIGNHIAAILHKFPPADLNIVLHSAAGGSGSVLGPLLVSELMTREVPTVIIAIGSADTGLDAENTLKTLMSYAAQVDNFEAPIVVIYIQNDPKQGRRPSDNEAIRAIMALAVLFSRMNRELDSQDLFHFLNFHRVTKFGPQLASLVLIESNETEAFLEQTKNANILSVATLTTDELPAAFPKVVAVQYPGYLPEMTKNVLDLAPMHFVITDSLLDGVSRSLNEVTESLTQSISARPATKSLLKGVKATNGGNIVL